jgi:hypothetical protein
LWRIKKLKQSQDQVATTVKSPVYQRRSPNLRAQIAAQIALRTELTADPVLSLAEFAAATGHPSYSAIRDLIRSGALKTWRASPRSHHKVRLSELRRFLAAGHGEQKAS